MNIPNRIFTILLMTLFTTSAFAVPEKCRYAQYRRNHPEKCGDMAQSTDNSFLALAGGATLIGVGIAMASQTTGSEAHQSTANMTSIYQRTSNAVANYNLSDTITNKRISAWSANNTNGTSDTTITTNIQTSDTYIRNKKQFDSVNMAVAQSRGYTGKNFNIAI